MELGRCRRRGECGGVLFGSSTPLGGYGTANGGLGWCCVESTYYATGGDSGSSVKLGVGYSIFFVPRLLFAIAGFVLSLLAFWSRFAHLVMIFQHQCFAGGTIGSGTIGGTRVFLETVPHKLDWA